ncbi:DUF4239 domain-containing protein [Cognatiyoonia sp. IB215446]|uniref:bestrophin-like domain n=1 Tax=Cognatiyoonia sp. IB215446 TaxID=3097355 RepID=UPI002A0B857C|nr:DUF4239 domain-containing protein [Cognatiyoonia sp. IB215446]MDX8348619.1 DUF4239 domain-containing protein [Cognatiyoonia sp. IB215446]
MTFVIALPLVLAFSTSFGNLSYTINVRIIFPISVGLFFVVLYHYFPAMMVASDQDPSARTAAQFGITSGVAGQDGIDEAFFKINDLFKDAVTVLYAICVAFLLLKGLNDYDDLKEALYSEANLVRTVSDYASYFAESGDPKKNGPVVKDLRCLLHDYLDNILQDTSIVTNPENEAVLEKCIATVGRLSVVDQNDGYALQEIMKGVGDLANYRAKRMVCLEKKMSPFILTLVFVMSLTIVMSFFGAANGDVTIDYVYVFLLPTFYTSIFMTLLDLSSPFDGYWQIKVDAVSNVRDRLEQQINAMREKANETRIQFKDPEELH